MKPTIKRITLSIITASMVLSAGTTTAFAARNNGKHCYVDANKDGICDHFNSSNKGCHYVDANKDGVCDHFNSSNKGCHYVDKNNDGICDNYNKNNKKHLHHRKKCSNFIDADKNGICDRHETHKGQKRKNCLRNGRCKRR